MNRYSAAVSESSAAFGQSKYQVRFDWGVDGAARIVPGAHIVVVVDALSFTTAVVVAAEHGVSIAPWNSLDEDGVAEFAAGLGAVIANRRGEPGPTLSPASFADGVQPAVVVLPSPNGGALVRGLEADGAVVLAASMRNRSAVASRILSLQEERGERMVVAVIAAGERGGDANDGRLRFAIEDQLVAGAVIDALVTLGLDHTSPEAAVACAAYEGLGHAVVHLIGASGSAAQLNAMGYRGDVRIATERDITTVVPELVDGVFRA